MTMAITGPSGLAYSSIPSSKEYSPQSLCHAGQILEPRTLNEVIGKLTIVELMDILALLNADSDCRTELGRQIESIDNPLLKTHASDNVFIDVYREYKLSEKLECLAIFDAF